MSLSCSCVRACIARPGDVVPLLLPVIGRLFLMYIARLPSLYYCNNLFRCIAHSPALLHQLVNCVVKVITTMQRRDGGGGENHNEHKPLDVSVTDSAEVEYGLPAAAVTLTDSSSSSAAAAAAAAAVALVSILATLPLALSCISRVRARRKDPSVKVREILYRCIPVCCCFCSCEKLFALMQHTPRHTHTTTHTHPVTHTPRHTHLSSPSTASHSSTPG
jgi:hypothetical protein